MSKQEIQFAISLIWITREIAHHKHKTLQTGNQPLHKTEVLRTGGFA